MIRVRNYSLLALITFGVIAQAAPLPPWQNRPAVIRAADSLAEAIAEFDEVMHAAHAPENLIGKVHHTEETVLEFAEAVRTCPFADAAQEMRHIQDDVQMIRMGLNRYHWLYFRPGVQPRWTDLRTAFRRLDQAMRYTGPILPPPPPPTGLTLNGVAYELLDKGTLVSTPTNVSGSGSLTFKDPLKEEDNNYTLAFTLEDQGALTLAANSDATLKESVKLTFARNGKALKVLLNVGDKTDDLSEEFSEVPADAMLKMSVDVHGHGHIVIWVGAGEEQEYSFTGDLEGKTWGLLLTKATVTSAKQDKPKDIH